MAIRAKDENAAKVAAGDLEPKVQALVGSMENASIAALASDFSDTSRIVGKYFYFFEQNIFQVFFPVVLKNCGKKLYFPKKKRTQATFPGRLCSSITAEPCSKFCPKSFKLYRMLAALGWAWAYGSTTASKFLS